MWVSVVGRPISGRLPFTFQVHSGEGRLTLSGFAAGLFQVEQLELLVTDASIDAEPQQYQNRRTQLRSLALRTSAVTLGERVAVAERELAGHGITALTARFCSGFVSVCGHVVEGPSAAAITFRIDLAIAGRHLRALASEIRVHGYLPTPGPVIADRMLIALLGAEEASDFADRPRRRSLCDVEVDAIGAALWHVMPPAGWRLPAVTDVEILSLHIGVPAAEVAFGPAGSRSGDLGVRPITLELARAHDLMYSADDALRTGQAEEAMRGYRALLAGGADQPFVIERILAVAAARPMWFIYGREVARQALGRWPQFAAGHSALAAINLAQGDAREAAGHLARVAQLAGSDDDQAAQAALASARLLRVLEPRAATPLYQLAVERDPLIFEAVDALADRLVDEQRWLELAQLLSLHAQRAEKVDVARTVALRLRLAEVYAHRLGDAASSRLELAAAQTLAPDDIAVHETTATMLTASDPNAAQIAWRQVARIAQTNQDRRTAGRAHAALGDLLAREDPVKANRAWQRAIEFDPRQSDAMIGLARASAASGDHAVAVNYYQRLRELRLAPDVASRLELELARSLVALERADEASDALQRASDSPETSAEAHVILSEIAVRTGAFEAAAAELDLAIAELVAMANARPTANSARWCARAAELAGVRAKLLDQCDQKERADADWVRAYELAAEHAPAIARDAARSLLSRAEAPAEQLKWLDAVLATRPPVAERAALLVDRAERHGNAPADRVAALADLHDALALTEGEPASAQIRRRAYTLEATLLADHGDQRARAAVLASLASLAERSGERVKYEIAAASAWLAADQPDAAFRHGAQAFATLDVVTDAAVRTDVLTTFGEAAWRQRAWPDVRRVYSELLRQVGDATSDVDEATTYRYRVAIAADRQGDVQFALENLQALDDTHRAAAAYAPALLLLADIAHRAGDAKGAAAALERFGNRTDPSTGAATPRARADAMLRAGELYWREGLADDAVRCLEAALQLSESLVAAFELLETIAHAQGHLDMALAVLGRHVAATVRYPRQRKAALTRLAELQDQLGYSEALATHQRALEIDSLWRPSLEFLARHAHGEARHAAEAIGLAQLASELPSDRELNGAMVRRERAAAVWRLGELVGTLSATDRQAVRGVVEPVLERAAADPELSGDTTDRFAGALARLRGETMTTSSGSPDHSARSTQAAETARPSVRITGTAEQNFDAVAAAAAAANRDRIVAAHREAPNDPALLAALLANLGDREPDLRRDVLDRAATHATGRAQAIALHELALGSGRDKYDPIRASALWNKAYRVDPTYSPVWLPFAEALSSAGEVELACDLYRKIADSSDYDAARRTLARERVKALQNSGSRERSLAPDVATGAARDLRVARANEDATSVASFLERAERCRAQGDLPSAVGLLEQLVRDYPDHVGAIEKLAELHTALGDWPVATRYLYQLVPFAPTLEERAERLYRLGEALLLHVGDVDRADDAFLRGSDLDPSHVPTLRRLLDVYWRADDPNALVEVAQQLVAADALHGSPVAANSLAHALIAAAVVKDFELAVKLAAALGELAAPSVTAALAELDDQNRRQLSLAAATAAIAELGKTGVLNLSKLRAPDPPPQSRPHRTSN